MGPQGIRAAWVRTFLERESVQAVALAILLAAASWPFPSTPGTSTLDQSWEAALYMAVQRGVHFGSAFDFTYGPLGFLTVPWPWYGPLTLLSLGLAAVLQFGVCLIAITGARRVLPLAAAVPVAYLGARGFAGFQPSEALLALVFAVCVRLLLRPQAKQTTRRDWIVAVVLGCIAGAAVFGKLSAGAFIAPIAGVTVLGLLRPWWRGLALYIGAASITALTLWLALGQRIVDLPAYVSAGFEMVRGYSEAMGVDRNPALHWYVPAFGAGVVVVGWFIVRGAGGPERRRAIAIGVIGALCAFAFFKIAFVRWGLGYAFGALMVAVFAVASPQIGRARFVAGFAVILLPLVAIGPTPLDYLSPIRSLRSLRSEVAVAVQPADWAAAEATTRQHFQSILPVDAAIVDALRGHRVHVDPFQSGVITAWPELTWQPLPVDQSYSAYTASLDAMNAALLEGPDAPDRILRAARSGRLTSQDGPPTIDGRNGWYDSPAAMVQTFCRYDEVAVSPAWEVLGLTNRQCGDPELLETVQVAAGSAVSVPIESRPNRLVIVRVQGLSSPLDSLITTLFKAPEWYISFDGIKRYRLVPGTAQDGLLMSVPTSIARSPGFEFGPARSSITVGRVDGASRVLTFEFLSIPLIST